jgi:cell division septation protein DedD
MKMTVEQVAKATKLSVATVRLHAANKKLGKKVGNRRYFDEKDLAAIKASPSSGSTKKKPAKAKPAARTPAARKKPARAAAAKPAPAPKPAPAAKPVPNPEKRSFWDFLRPRPKQKVSLPDAKVKK